jgi:beta-galactosidase
MTERRSPGDLSYVESFSPGSGYVPARASAARGTRQLSLDGTWKFRFCPGLGDLTAGFEATDFDDAGFDDITVPSLWQLAGIPGPPRYSPPAYTNVTYPFPVDPPRVPDRNPAGEYQRCFTLPPDWDLAGSTVLRFDGVDSCFAVFVNGAAVGNSQGSRLMREFDVSELVRPVNNVLAVRARRAPPQHAHDHVRVRPRHGQRARRPDRVPGPDRPASAAARRVHLGMDRPRHHPDDPGG